MNPFLIFLALPFAVWLFFWLHHSGKVKVIGRGRKSLKFLKGKEDSLYYFAHVYYGLNSIYNTISGFKYGKTKSYRPRREILIGADGGEFAIDWFEDDRITIPDDAPIIVS